MQTFTKRFIAAYFLILSIAGWSQAVQNIAAESDGPVRADSFVAVSKGHSSTGNHERKLTDKDIINAFKQYDILIKDFNGLPKVQNGYYLIAGVFKTLRNSKRNVSKFQRKGFNAGALFNPKNDLNYVYLNVFENWEDALDACRSNLEGSYSKPIWVMKVNNNSVGTTSLAPQKEISKEPVSINEVTYDMLTSARENKDSLKTKENPNRSRLLKKADDYFNKMWYAEAAELYDEALTKYNHDHSFEVLQKAGDAYYFNTNMEKAYQWYSELYEKYKKEMSADNLFKYAHSLKGTGKYGRAKRLMRLYNRKLKQEPETVTNDQETPNEVVLDNILTGKPKFEIKDLSINSEYSDFAPAFYNKDEIVYASAKDSSFLNTRRYKWNNQPYLDLYVAKINQESQDLKNAVKFSKKINTKYHEAAVTFSPDNNTMYFTRNNYGKKLKRDKNGINNLKIYMSTKVDGEWTDAKELPFNSDSYSTGHPALTADGKKLYFVSDMPGSIGETDIFVVDVLGNGKFSAPRNLGPHINTEKREMFPFINDKKLYFSSDGRVGLGGLDVYEVAYDDNGFKEVKNVGRPINSNKDDFSYIVNEDTQQGFFASNRLGGKGDDDIYSFKRLMVDEVKPNKNAINGVVTDLVTGDVMPKTLITLLDENNIKLKEVMTNDDGSFVFEDLEGTTKYTIKTEKGTYFSDEQTVATKDNEVVNMTVSMKKLKQLITVEDGIKKLKVDNIYFNFDKYTIRKDAAVELDKLVETMKEYKDMVIKIESHTDSRGSRAYNKYLSDKRAKSSRDYIISKGIAPERIQSAIGYGEEKLINECANGVPCSRKKQALNRRSEFIIVKM